MKAMYVDVDVCVVFDAKFIACERLRNRPWLSRALGVELSLKDSTGYFKL